MSFDSASREYENKLPSEGKPEHACLMCKGTKIDEDASDCCGAETRKLGTSGEPLCTACGEPCEYDKCQHCNGSGIEL